MTRANDAVEVAGPADLPGDIEAADDLQRGPAGRCEDGAQPHGAKRDHRGRGQPERRREDADVEDPGQEDARDRPVVPISSVLTAQPLATLVATSPPADRYEDRDRSGSPSARPGAACAAPPRPCRTRCGRRSPCRAHRGRSDETHEERHRLASSGSTFAFSCDPSRGNWPNAESMICWRSSSSFLRTTPSTVTSTNSRGKIAKNA